MPLIDAWPVFAKWLNENQGVLSVILFLITLFIAWISGIFSALRRNPKFKITLLGNPSFSCTFTTGRKHNGRDMQRTAIALYLQIINIGNAPSSIEKVAVGYHWDAPPFKKGWFWYMLTWCWIKNQIAILTDFQTKVGDDNTHVFPFLFQGNYLLTKSTETFLEVGRSTSGVIYFEEDSWGKCCPLSHKGKTRLKVRVTDAFGKYHYAEFIVPVVTLEYARRFNPSFGKTLAEIYREPLPFDLEEKTRVAGG